MMPEYPVEIQLKDGTPVLIRPITPADKNELRIGFSKLSPESRYCRFISYIDHLSENQLDYLTHIDNINHFAICAIDARRNHMTGIGVARYFRLEKTPDVAEVALTVIDEYQNRGLGMQLLMLLGRSAKANNIKKLVGYVLENNIRMMKILKHFNTNNRRESTNLLLFELIL
jgi:RimJ/RimL family protein N-acetyltransferase